MVNRLCAAVRRCAAAIAIDPSVEPAQNRCCFKRFFISVRLLLLNNFESRTERGRLPVPPFLFPGRRAAPRRAESRLLLCRAAGRIRFPPKPRRWGGGGLWSRGRLLERFHTPAAAAVEEVLFCEEGFCFFPHIYDEEGGRAARTLSIWLRLAKLFT